MRLFRIPFLVFSDLVDVYDEARSFSKFNAFMKVFCHNTASPNGCVYAPNRNTNYFGGLFGSYPIRINSISGTYFWEMI